MTSLVLVVGEDRQVRALAGDLAAAGLEVETAPDGFYATLFLERNDPIAVVMPQRLSDMTALELGSILAEDPSLRSVRRILIGDFVGSAGELPKRTEIDLFDLVLPADLDRDDLSRRVLGAMGRGEDFSGSSLRGSLDAVDFPQLIQLLAESGDPGVLRLDLGAVGGRAGGLARLFFDQGEIVHCSLNQEAGEQAFDHLLGEALVGGGEFRYKRLSKAEVFRVSRNLRGRVDQLLLSAAARSDEQKRALAGAGGGVSGG